MKGENPDLLFGAHQVAEFIPNAIRSARVLEKLLESLHRIADAKKINTLLQDYWISRLNGAFKVVIKY